MEIKDVIHLYLGCDFMYSVSGNEPTRMTLNADQLSVFYQLADDPECDYKLILRPLSSMTEEEKVKIFKLSFGEDHNFDMFGYDPIEQIILADKDGRTRAGISVNSMGAEVVRYLLSQGFDLFGLIDAGLAIDRVTTLKH